MNQRAILGVPSIRTLLLLGRTSNLPTVWSNCLAGWIISGGGEPIRLLLVCAGASLLYVGGMFLNDAFDADFDRQHRPERPIPSGAIARSAVWQLGFLWLVLGVLMLWMAGKTVMLLAIALAICILFYDGIHKWFLLSPLLMAGCRFLLVLMASAAATKGIIGLTYWTALVLASYIVGLSYLARRESLGSPLQYWPCILLAAPLVLAIIVNRGTDPESGVHFYRRALVLAGVVVFWMARSLRFAYWSHHPHVGRSVAALLAGIVLVDWLSTGGLAAAHNGMFAALFILALVMQRLVPAT